MTTQAITTGPAGWEWIGQMYAMLPFLIIVMVLVMVMKIASRLTEPEVLKEAVIPAAKEVVAAKYLPAGGEY